MNLANLANLDSCDEMGVCLARNPPFRNECQQYIAKATSEPAEPDPEPPKDDSLLYADTCQSLCWLVICTVIGGLAFIAGTALVWKFNPELRDFFWAAASTWS